MKGMEKIRKCVPAQAAVVYELVLWEVLYFPRIVS